MKSKVFLNLIAIAFAILPGFSFAGPYHEYLLVRGVSSKQIRHFAVVELDAELQRAKTLYEVAAPDDARFPVLIHDPTGLKSPLLYVLDLSGEIHLYNPATSKWVVLDFKNIERISAGPEGWILAVNSNNEVLQIEVDPSAGDSPHRHRIAKMSDFVDHTYFALDSAYWIEKDQHTGADKFAVGIESNDRFSVFLFKLGKNGFVEIESSITEEYIASNVGLLKDFYVTKNGKLWTAHVEERTVDDVLYYTQWDLKTGAQQFNYAFDIDKNLSSRDDRVEIIDWSSQNGPLVVREFDKRLVYDPVSNHEVRTDHFYTATELVKFGAQFALASYTRVSSESRNGHRDGQSNGSNASPANSNAQQTKPLGADTDKEQKKEAAKAKEVEAEFAALENAAIYIGMPSLYRSGIITASTLQDWLSGLMTYEFLSNPKHQHERILYAWLKAALSDSELKSELLKLGLEETGNQLLRPCDGCANRMVPAEKLFQIFAKAALRLESQTMKRCQSALTDSSYKVERQIDPYEWSGWTD